MLQGMDQSEFGQFVAALWEQQGWQTQVKRDDGRVFVAAQRPQTGEEGLLWAVAGGGEVGGQEAQQFASLCQQYEVEEGAIVTAGTFSDHAQKVAQGSGLELLDGEGVEAIVQRNELTHLVEQYGGDTSVGDDGDDSAGDSPLDRAQAVAGRVAGLVSGVVESAVGDADVELPVSGTVAVVAVVALLGVGVLVGPSVPFLGGGGGPVSAESTTPNGSATTLHVEWNAEVVDTIDPNESDDTAYYPPKGETFVLVTMSINNTGESKVPLKQSAFRLRTGDETHGHQPLVGIDGFVDFPIAPGENRVVWTVFSVPEGSGTLVYDQNVTNVSVAIEFEHNPDLPVTVSKR